MKFNKNDYIICQEGKKKYLCQIVNPKEKVCVVCDKTIAHENTKIYLNYEESLLAYLGPNLYKGSVYGVKLEPYFKRSIVKGYSGVYYFVDVNEEQKSNIELILLNCFKVFKNKGFSSIFPIDVDIRPNKGRKVGCAKTVFDSDGGEYNYMTLTVKDLSSDFSDVVYHEFAHFLYNTLFSNKHKAKWTKLYSDYVDVKEADEYKLRKFKKLCKSQGIYAIQDPSVDEDIAQAVVDYIRDYHSLRLKDLYLLSDNSEDITCYFPNTLELKEHKAVISDYAKENVEEFVAEAFSFYLCKKDLPKKIKKLVKKTIISLKK